MLLRTKFLTSYIMSIEFVLCGAQKAPEDEAQHPYSELSKELNMYVTPEQIQAASKTNVESFLAVANAQFAALEKLANIQASAMKSAFEDSIANTRALLGAKDVQEFVSLQNSFAQPTLEKAMAYSKSVYEVATGANAELSKVAERRVAEWNENF